MGREYLRVSQDRSGRARSVEEQHEDNQRSATTCGVTLGAPYVDNSVSASRYASKSRDDFAKLIADLDKGRFDADELWLWEPSRGSRRVSEWVELIEACERAGVTIYVTTHGRTYDPTNGRDRRSLLEDAVDSEYESSKVSDRSKRAAAANAAAGKPHGSVPFGYRRIYDQETRRLVRQEPHPDEAPVVREVYDRLTKGHSFRAIAADFEARGIRTRPRKDKAGVLQPGKLFTPQHLRDLVLAPVYAGLRVHDPKGKAMHRRHHLEGAVTGTWEPLVPEATYFAVRQMLSRPERKTSRGGKAKHLLSLIAQCHVCGGPLSVTTRREAPEYACHRKGCVRIAKTDLDEVAEGAILQFLAEPDVFDTLAAADDGDQRLQQVRDDLGVARNELAELRAGVAAGRLSVANLTVIEPGLLARVATLEEQERDLSTPSALRGLITPGKNVGKSWDAAEVSTRRAIARMLLTPEFLGHLQVAQRPEGRRNIRVPAGERVQWVRNPGPHPR